MTRTVPVSADASPGSPATAYLLLVALTIFWGINWPILKIGIADVPVFTYRGICSLAGAAGLFAIAAAGRLPMRVPRSHWGWLIVASVLNITGWNVLMLFGLDYMSSGRAAILAYTMPLWATLLSAAVLGDRLTLRQGIGVLLGMAGMAVLLGGGLAAMRQAPLGAGLVIAAAISWASGTVVLKRARFPLAVTALTAWQQLIGGLPVLVLMLVYDPAHWHLPSAPAALSLVYNMVVTAIFCYWAWFRIVTALPVVVSTVGTLMIPVVGVASGVAMLGETPGLLELAALVLVAGAIAFVNLPGRRPPRSLLR